MFESHLGLGGSLLFMVQARKAIKASLMEAESTNMHNLQKVGFSFTFFVTSSLAHLKLMLQTKLDEVTEDDKDNSSDKDDVKNDEFLEPKEQKFTWAQLQAGLLLFAPLCSPLLCMLIFAAMLITTFFHL